MIYTSSAAPEEPYSTLRETLSALVEPQLDIAALSAMARAQGGLWLTPFQGVTKTPQRLDVKRAGAAITRPDRESAALQRDSDAIRAELLSVLADVVPHDGVSVAMSAGLDSTVLAGLAATIAPVQALHASPRTNTPDRLPRRDADEWQLARLMTRDRLEVVRMLNTDNVSWLDLALDFFARNLTPLPAPRNAWWLASAERHAHARGHSALLVGTGGNASFSRGEHVRTPLDALLGNHSLTPRRHAIKRRILSVAHKQRFQTGQEGPPVVIGPPVELPDHVKRMPPWVRWCLAGPLRAPAAMTGLPVEIIDPYRDPRVITLAMSFPQSTWTAKGLSRSLARRTAEGIVPDEIRLRTRRGHQSADFPEQVLEQASRYEEVIERISQSESASSFLDLNLLRASTPLLRGGIPQAQKWITWYLRPVSVGYFAAWWDDTGRLAYT